MKAYPEPVVTPAEIHVTLLPPDHIDYHLRTVRVVRIDPDAPDDRQWAVTAVLDQCLGRDGTWCSGPQAWGRGEEWLAEHRFSVGEALLLAQNACASVVVNGITTAAVVERDGAIEGRGRDSSRALKEVRTVLSRAETARSWVRAIYDRRPEQDRDAAQMRAALDVSVALLGRWRRVGRSAD
ncbi:hypothetical protein ACPCBF_24895 [Streptomyces pseudogriseolus]|uniref:hypothetical protein n=1 Tax=Streptomyces pseudogriseolus TaxID=36817 RepID=UPI003FA26055